MTPLWGHQQAAVSFVQERWNKGLRGVLLAIIMGGGKSRVAIELALRNLLTPILILAPLRVVEVWRTQFGLYAPEYDFLALDDRVNGVRRKAVAARDRLAWATARKRPLAIAINWQSARLEPFASWALANTWPLVIGDELHKIKEPAGATSRFAGHLALKAHRRLGLTGTPMPHSPLDVWAQFRFLDRTLYDPTYTSFRLRYAITNPYFHHQVESYRDLDDLRRRFFSLSFQVGEEVLDLPEAHEQTLYCTLSAKGREAYNAMELEFVAWVGAGRMVTASNALVRLMRLQQITSGVVKDTAGNDCVVDISKRQLLEDLLEDLAADEPVVVFAHFKSDLASVHEVARSLGRASGEVSGDHSRRDDLAAWQRGRAGDPVILAVQIQAGEAGIDLTRSRYGIYFSLDYNLGHYLQSRKRLHRHGQKWPVMFYHLMAADTIDQKVAGALERRQQLVESVLQEYEQCHQTTAS